MTEKQKKWFEDFAAAKKEEVQSIERGGDAKIWKYISDHYSDKAHFLYELIQNADDAGATYAKFELYPEGDGRGGALVFRHNGYRHFGITKAAPRNGEAYEEALRGRTLDSVYSICTVGNSTKQTNDIGKFGIGFKSVFVYTNTPQIYDDGIRFEISDFVVPVSLEDREDFEGRQKGETVFVLPFNRTKGDHLPKDPCKDVQDKLRSLILPTLFLNNLKEVSWKFGECEGRYHTKREVLFNSSDGTGSRVLRVEADRSVNDSDSVNEEFLLIERPIEKDSSLSLTIGFGIKDGKLVPLGYAPFCYFATQVSFGLKFIVNAPFVLTSTRQSLDFASDESISNNAKMMDGLSTLLADALVYLRDLGRQNKGRFYLTEDIFKILPLDGEFVPPQELDKLNIQRNDHNNYFSGFYTKPLEKFRTEEIIPCSFAKGHCRKESACYAYTKGIVKTFNDADLQSVSSKLNVQSSPAYWVYANTFGYTDSSKADSVDKYIALIGAHKVVDEDWIRAVAGDYISSKAGDDRWLMDLYDWMANVKREVLSRSDKLQLLLDQDGNAQSAKDAEGSPNLYLGTDLPSDIIAEEQVHVINLKICKFESVKKLGMTWGMTSFTRESMVERLFRQACADLESRELMTCRLAQIANDDSIPVNCKGRIVEWIRANGVLKAKSGELRPLCELHLDSEFWTSVSDAISGDFAKKFLADVDFYFAALGEGGLKVLESAGLQFLPHLVKRGPYMLKDDGQNIWYKRPWLPEGERKRHAPLNSRIGSYLDYLDRVGVEYAYTSLWFRYVDVPIVKDILAAQNAVADANRKQQYEKIIWRILEIVATSSADAENCFSGEYYGAREYAQIGNDGHLFNQAYEVRQKFDSLLVKDLREKKWISCADGYVAPNGIVSDRLAQEIVDLPHFEVIAKWLNITTSSDVEESKSARRANLNDHERKMLELAERFSIELERLSGGSVAADVRAKDNGLRDRKREVPEEEKYLSVDAGVMSWLKERTEANEHQNDAAEIEDVFKVEDAKVVSIPELLSMNLLIPDYQRPYKWDRENVWDFLDDIMRMVVNPHSERGCDWSALPYRMGSIILHQQQDGHYAIVDGQQRTLTFILLAIALGEECRLMSSRDFYPALSQMSESRRNLNNNLHYICEYFKTHGNNFKDDFRKALEKSLQVVVVCVSEQDQAFQLFDSQNVKGRRLEPHDLLKAYHLREMEESLKSRQNCSNEDNLVSRAVTEWENFKIQDLGYLFDKLLYPILKWSGKERCYGFTTRDLKAFKGVPQRWLEKYGYVGRAFAAKGKYQIGSEFAPGLEFFDMVAHYQSLLGEVRKRAEKCEKVKAVLDSTCNNAYTKALFEAVLLAYFDRFGIAGLASEEVDAAIRALCKWVFTVRLDLQYFSPKTPNKYALGVVDGSVKYTNRIAMFSAIRNAVFHTDITKLPVEMSHVSLEGQNTDARKALWEAVNEL